MKTKSSALAVLLLFSILSLYGTVFDNTASGSIDPNWYGTKPLYYNITMVSPEPQVFIKDNESVALNFVVQSNDNTPKVSFCYTLDNSGELLHGAIWDSFLKVNENTSQTLISNDSLAPDKPYDPYIQATSECTATLPQLSYGLHNITIYHGFNYNFRAALYSNLKTFYFNVSEPLNISILSPENKTYNSNNASLNFSSNGQIEWSGYSIDGKENITISGNTTLNGLPSGLHKITVYANDTYGNMGTSETVSFSTANPFPILTVVAISGVIVLVVGAGLLVYFKKHKRNAVNKS